MKNESKTTFSLSSAKKGLRITIKSIPSLAISLQALRLGIGEESQVTLKEKLRHGPVILLAGRQEIAVGYQLALRIMVEESKTGGEAWTKQP